MAANQIDQAPIVIVGTGLAGYTLAREFRKLDKESPVLMVTADDGHSYSKPMLSTGFSKKKTADQLSMADPGRMAEQLNVEIRTFTTVTGIDHKNRQLMVGEERIVYDRLVLAWGADVIRLALPGDAQSSVYSINDLMDYRAFRQAATNKKRVLIMGAGLIGCEFANDLLADDYHVDIVAPSDTVLPGLLPPEAGNAVQNALSESGIVFHLGTTVAEINQQDGAVHAVLGDGSTVICDLIISAVGLRPRTDIAAKAGLDIGTGIKVNSLLETNAEHVFAFGDCAEVNGQNLLYVAPLMACARALARTLNGEPTKVTYPIMPVVVKTPACPVAVSSPPAGSIGEWHITANDSDVEALFKDAEGKLLGFALTGVCVDKKQTLTKTLAGVHS